MSEQTYTYGAKYICIRQSDDQPGAQYEPIAQCLSGHYDSPSWAGHAAFLVEAANSYASSQAEIERLKTALKPFADYADGVAGRRDDQLEIGWMGRSSETGEYVDISVTAKHFRDARAALSGSKE